MKKGKILVFIKDFLYVSVISLFSIVLIIFSHLYIDLFSSGLLYLYSNIIKLAIVGVTTLFSVFALVFYKLSKEFLFKLIFTSIIFATIFLICLYFLKITGVWNKFDSVEKLRSYIKSFGKNAIFIFVFISFAQVVFLPIPSFITVGAGVLLFGPFESFVYSLIGIFLGSIVAYFVGKFFGYPVVKWLVGKDALDKGLKAIKGKDKIILTFMFLFPFFPDDILCFVAGITTIKAKFFLSMVFITRTISLFTACYSLNNNLIPYNTWWGVLIWVVIIAATILLTIFIYKKGQVLEKIFEKRKKASKNQAK